MPSASRHAVGRIRTLHPYQWLWEPLQSDPTFFLRSMFGAKAAYLDGKLMLCFIARNEPWRGVLVCTDRPRHPALRGEFPELVPHRVLPKWLYLPETSDAFERLAMRLVTLARQRDPRLGIAPAARRKRKARKRPARTKPRP